MTQPNRSVALVGVGPTASSVLERLAASAPELLGDTPFTVHLVDPFPFGQGRVWRPDQSPLLWMNSMAEDVTIFTDTSVRIEGPVRTGPTLLGWSRQVLADPAELAHLPPAVVEELRTMTGMTFPTRLVQTGYLDWFHRRLRAAMPPGISICEHHESAVDIRDRPDGGQTVTTASGEQIHVDVVVLCLGHLDAVPDAADRATMAFAEEHGLVFMPAGHTAEFDLTHLVPGMHVIARGFGQAFTDLVAELTEGRGGRFATGPQGSLRYEPSGLEPVIHVGSRRGVPYRSKLDYRLQAPFDPERVVLTDDVISALINRDSELDFSRDILPLVLREVGWAYYRELFTGHPEVVSMPWERFAPLYLGAPTAADVDALVASAVPHPQDQFDLLALDRPLRHMRFGSYSQLQTFLRTHIDSDVARRTDPRHSGDLAAFTAMLLMMGVLGRFSASGRVSHRSRVEEISGWWFDFFMYYASGPPPARLRQLLALADAGVVTFVGADMDVVCDPCTGRFAATSVSHGEHVHADALVDARIARPTVSRTADPLLRALFARGEVVEEVVADPTTGWTRNTGKVLISGPDLRLVEASGRVHPRRHALGVFTSRPAAGAFARPRTNAPAFRQNDTVARSVLRCLGALGESDPAATSGPTARSASHP